MPVLQKKKPSCSAKPWASLSAEADSRLATHTRTYRVLHLRQEHKSPLLHLILIRSTVLRQWNTRQCFTVWIFSDNQQVALPALQDSKQLAPAASRHVLGKKSLRIPSVYFLFKYLIYYQQVYLSDVSPRQVNSKYLWKKKKKSTIWMKYSMASPEFLCTLYLLHCCHPTMCTLFVFVFF